MGGASRDSRGERLGGPHGVLGDRARKAERGKRGSKVTRLSVELLGNFFDNHSLSIINRNVALELAKFQQDIDLVISPLDRPRLEWKVDPVQIDDLVALASRAKREADVQIRHVYPPLWKWPEHERTRVIFIQPWDYIRIPFELQYKFETFADAVITPSRWVADNFLRSGLNPEYVFVVPNGYNPEIFNCKEEESKFFDSAKFTFLFAGNHLKRKGLDLLLDVWKSTFVHGEPVRLFIRDNPHVYGRNELAAIAADLPRSSGCAEVLYSAAVLSEREVANIYKSAGVLVHPYRGEGFGMHVQEGVACGAFPIVTEGGPTDEFIPQDIGLRIGSHYVPLDLTHPELCAIKPGDSLTLMGWFGETLEPKVDALRECLQWIFGHPERERLLAKVRTYQNPNTWDSVARSYLRIIETVCERSDDTRRRRHDRRLA